MYQLPVNILCLDDDAAANAARSAEFAAILEHSNPLRPGRSNTLRVSITYRPSSAVANGLQTHLDSMRFLLRDRYDKYSPDFDAIFHAEEMDIPKTAAQAPRMNAHCERIIKTIRSEMTDRMLILNESHARENTAHTSPEISYQPTPNYNPPRFMTSTPAECCGHASSMD